MKGPIGRLHTPLLHEDFKGLHAYIDRHNRYSTWEAELRYRYLSQGAYGADTIKPRLFGNTQERRRWIKGLLIRLPGEPLIWFLYHYVFRLGFLEGRAHSSLALFARGISLASALRSMRFLRNRLRSNWIKVISGIKTGLTDLYLHRVAIGAGQNGSGLVLRAGSN